MKNAFTGQNEVSWESSPKHLIAERVLEKTDEPVQKKRIENFPEGYGVLKWGDTPETLGNNGALGDLDSTSIVSMYKKRVEGQTSYLGLITKLRSSLLRVL
jgi:hypothetical protein